MFEFIRKSPLGFVFTAAAVVLALSPEARETARKAAVKGAAVVLDMVDKIKESSYVQQMDMIESSSDLSETSEVNHLTEENSIQQENTP